MPQNFKHHILQHLGNVGREGGFITPVSPGIPHSVPHLPAVSLKCLDTRARLCIHFASQKPLSLGTLEARGCGWRMPRLRFRRQSSQPGKQLKINTHLPPLFFQSPSLLPSRTPQRSYPQRHTYTHTNTRTHTPTHTDPQAPCPQPWA